MDYEKKGKCDDCNNANDLILASACAESEVGYGSCCEKYICKNGQKVYWSDSFGSGRKDRAKIKSKTFPGIAKAMAEQWSR